MTAPEALRRLLVDCGMRAARVGTTAFRIERAPHPRRSTPPPRLAEPASAPAPMPPPDPIVVTGQKRPQALQDVAMSVSIVPLAGDTDGRLTAGTGDIALLVDGLALTNLGPGRNRQFIRGVADSPFNGPSQSTVAVQLDETRVTFDAPDPDLRLVDMDRVEVLKGPQGPLYGSGALGGIYHLVSNKPDLSAASGRARLLTETVEHGGQGGGAEAVVNLPLDMDRLAVRGTAYAVRSAGWIDNIGGRRNANLGSTEGGRLGLRWRPDADWTLDLSGVLQNINSKDSQYVTASVETTRRLTRIAEPADNDFRTVAATIEGRIGTIKLLATSSYVDHGVAYTLDATDAASQFGLSGVTRFRDDRAYSIRNHEVRLSPATSSIWLVGLSYMQAESRSLGTLASPDAVVIAASLHRKVTEVAAFGEATVALREALKATAGVRLFRSIARDETLKQSAEKSEVSKAILSPSVSLAWTPDDRSLVYLRYARAIRPGGLAPTNQTMLRRFDADELGNFDLGYRYAIAGYFSIAASAFYTRWSDIQSDYLLPSGLVSTRNAGSARILGVEGSLDWEVGGGLSLSTGVSYIDAELVRASDGVRLRDRRLPVTPDLTGRLALRYGLTVAGWTGSLSAQVNYVGRARLSFVDSLDRRMGNYATASAAVSFTRGHLGLAGRIDNLFDISGNSFTFGNPFSILVARQFTPLRPRTFSLSISRSW
ncbi:MAG: TonB-dependent receptor [Novosphingobium sp.]